MNGKGVYRLRDMIGPADVQAGLPGGRWVRAVPLPFYPGLRTRLRAAWEVICCRAYATEWPDPGDLEKALGRSLEQIEARRSTVRQIREERGHGW